MQRHFLSINLLLIIILAIFGCSGQKSATDEQQAKAPVEVMPIKLGNVVQNLFYNGDIKAEYEIKVFSKIPDRIEKYFIDEGNFVTKGAPIARIYATTIEQAVKQAEAGLAAAKAQEANVRVEYERAKRLSQENAMSKQQFDLVQTQYEAVKAGLEQAQAAVTSAKSTLDDATVTAPIPGIVGKRYYEAGDMANPAIPLVSIVQMDRVKITFAATESDLGRLMLGQEAVTKVKSYPDEKFVGNVVKISPVLDPLTRMATIEVMIKNHEHKLKPGMFGQVEVTTGILKDVIVVPRFATIENTILKKVDGQDQVSTEYYVYVINNDKAEQRKLDVTYINHIQMAVAGGINIGEKIVISGQANLRDGSLVTVVKEEGVVL